MAADSLFCRIYGIIGTSEKKGGFRMPQSEMEALIQLQKETIESLRQVGGQPASYDRADGQKP